MSGSNKKGKFVTFEIIGVFILLGATVGGWYWFFERPNIIEEENFKLAIASDQLITNNIVHGPITSITKDSLTVMSDKESSFGKIFTVQFDSNTKFLASEDEIGSFQDLEIGGEIAATAQQPITGQIIYATKIKIL